MLVSRSPNLYIRVGVFHVSLFKIGFNQAILLTSSSKDILYRRSGTFVCVGGYGLTLTPKVICPCRSQSWRTMASSGPWQQKPTDGSQVVRFPSGPLEPGWGPSQSSPWSAFHHWNFSHYMSYRIWQIYHSSRKIRINTGLEVKRFESWFSTASSLLCALGKQMSALKTSVPSLSPERYCNNEMRVYVKRIWKSILFYLLYMILSYTIF